MKRKHCLKVNNELLKKKFTNIEKNVRQKENRIKNAFHVRKTLIYVSLLLIT